MSLSLVCGVGEGPAPSWREASLRVSKMRCSKAEKQAPMCCLTVLSTTSVPLCINCRVTSLDCSRRIVACIVHSLSAVTCAGAVAKHKVLKVQALTCLLAVQH